MVKKFRRYDYSFWRDPRTWRTDGQTLHDISVNACRKNLFARKGLSMESIPPTRDALIQHTKRACFQAVFIGTSAWKFLLLFHMLVTGDGSCQMDSGTPCGWHYPRLQKLVVNYWSVDARKVAQKTASALKPWWSARHCAIVEENATTLFLRNWM